MKLVVGMNSGLGLIRCHSNDCAFAREVVLEKPKPKCSAGRSKVNISSSPVRSTTGLSARPLLFLAYINDMPETIIHNKSKSSISFGSYIVHMFVPG
jgi:hypothetical protein